MDARQTKELLNARVEEVCRHLLPAGKREQSEWAVGDVSNTPGQSLRVHLGGSKCGVWADFATNTKGGSLLDLWMAVRKCNFQQAITEAKDFLGVRDEGGWRRVKAAAASCPIPQSLGFDLSPVVEGSAVWRWLTETRRISPESIRAYRIGEKRVTFEGTEHECVVFPSYTAAGRLVRLKIRSITDKKRMFVKPRKAEGGFDLLFGWQAVPPEQQDLFLTEGELDAMALHSFGMPAVSLPMGAQPTKTATQGADKGSPHDEWLERDYDRLEQFLEAYLCLDADKPGQDATRILIPRLGRMRCQVVQWPDGMKDANDCRMKDMNDDKVSSLFHDAKSCDPDELKLPSQFRDEIWELWHPSDAKSEGVPLPWAMPFMVRPGEVTLWQGYTKHGKTTCLSHSLTHWAAKYGHKALIASFEMPGAITIENILRQATGKQKTTTMEELDDRLRWMDQHFLIYDYVGDAKSPQVMDVFEYAARKYGVQHVVLDSLMKIVDVEGDDFSAQRTLVNRLGLFADEFNLHIHLVAHSKKPDSKHPQEKCWPGVYDVMGSSYLVNLADNIVCVWRNILKTQTMQVVEQDLAMEQAKAARDGTKIADLQAQLEKEQAKNDALIIVQGQRKTGEMPIKNLWFDAGLEGSWQFRDDPRGTVEIYLP